LEAVARPPPEAHLTPKRAAYFFLRRAAAVSRRSCSASARARMEALRSRRVDLALASISSRSRSVRCWGAEWDALRRWDLRGWAVER
jgi:hypothetical protein